MMHHIEIARNQAGIALEQVEAELNDLTPNRHCR